MLGLWAGLTLLPTLLNETNDTLIDVRQGIANSTPANATDACSAQNNIWANEDCLNWIKEDASRCEASNYQKNCALQCCASERGTPTTTATAEAVTGSPYDAVLAALVRPTIDASGSPVQCGGRVSWDELSATGQSPESLRIGLDPTECKATVVALFAPWCAPCQRLAHLMLTLIGEPWAGNVCWKMLLYAPGEKGNDEIWSSAKESASPDELEKISTAVSNVSTYRVEHGECSQWCTGSNFNRNAGKDDFYVFDRLGRLTGFVPYRENLRFLQTLDDAEAEASRASLPGWSVAEGLRATLACDCECRERTGYTLSPTAEHQNDDGPPDDDDDTEAPGEREDSDEEHPDDTSEPAADDSRACALAVDKWVSHPCDQLLLHLKRLNSTSEQAVQYYCDATGADSCQSLAREAGRLCEGTRLQELATELGKDGMSGFSQKMRSLVGPDHSNAELEEVSCFPSAAPEVKAAQVTL
jgi:hypothetical protein